MGKTTVDQQWPHSMAGGKMHAKWVELMQQQYGSGHANLARLVPWDLQIQVIQLQKYAKSNPEPD